MKKTGQSPSERKDFAESVKAKRPAYFAQLKTKGDSKKINTIIARAAKQAEKPKKSGKTHKQIVAEITEQNRRYYGCYGKQGSSVTPKQKDKSVEELRVEEIQKQNLALYQAEQERLTAANLGEHIQTTVPIVSRDMEPKLKWTKQIRVKIPSKQLSKQEAESLVVFCPNGCGNINQSSETSLADISKCPNCGAQTMLVTKGVEQNLSPTQRKAYEIRDGKFFEYGGVVKFGRADDQKTGFRGTLTVVLEATVLIGLVGFLFGCAINFFFDTTLQKPNYSATPIPSPSAIFTSSSNRPETASDNSSSKWTQGASANGYSWNETSADAKWDLANRLASQSRYGVSAQKFYDGLNAAYNTSDSQMLEYPIRSTVQYIEESKNPDNYK